MDLNKVLTDIAKAIVDKPDDVSVESTENGRDIKMVLHVAPDDMGKVIGRHGRIAKAIRSLMKAASNTDNRRVTVEIE